MRVNAVAPAVVKTQFAQALYAHDEEGVASRYPLRRLGRPDDVGAAIAFLLSDDASGSPGRRSCSTAASRARAASGDRHDAGLAGGAARRPGVRARAGDRRPRAAGRAGAGAGRGVGVRAELPRRPARLRAVPGASGGAVHARHRGVRHGHGAGRRRRGVRRRRPGAGDARAAARWAGRRRGAPGGSGVRRAVRARRRGGRRALRRLPDRVVRPAPPGGAAAGRDAAGARGGRGRGQRRGAGSAWQAGRGSWRWSVVPRRWTSRTSLGADAVVDRLACDGVDGLVAALREACPDGADVVFDPVGGDAFTASTKVVAFEGRVVVVGFTSGEVPRPPANHLLLKNYAVLGLHWGPYQTRAPELVRQAQHEIDEARRGRPGAAAGVEAGRLRRRARRARRPRRRPDDGTGGGRAWLSRCRRREPASW
nr:SDR family oxidoreductase [Angustibacter aerolatus]